MTPEPFPHLVQAGSTLLGSDLIAAVDQHWPAPDWPGWVRYAEAGHSKHASDVRAAVPQAAGEALHRLALLPWGDWMGQKGLVPDLGLWGAGLHEMRPGEGVAIHLDADHHPRLKLERRLSVMLYVHRRWELDWGGDLELWDAARTAPVVRIAPAPRRIVAMDARGAAYHSVAPVSCPDGLTRRSLGLWFYGPQTVPHERPRAKFTGAAAGEARLAGPVHLTGASAGGDDAP